MKYGVQLYTLRRYLKTVGEVRNVFEWVAKQGIEYAQLSGLCEIKAEELKKISEDTGVKICSTHTPFEDIKNNLDKMCEEHLLYGASAIGVGSMPPEYRNNNFERINEFLDIACDTAERVKKYNLKFTYHNHQFEFKEKDGKKVMDILIEKTPMDFILDTYWVVFAKNNIEEYIRKMDGRMINIHLKDYKKFLFLPIMQDVGSGIIDFKKLMPLFEKAGTEVALVEHDMPRNPYKSVENSFKYIRENLI